MINFILYLSLYTEMKIASCKIIDFYTVCKQTWFSFFHNLFFFKSLQTNNYRGISRRKMEVKRGITRKFKKRRCPPVNVRFVDSLIKQTSEEPLGIYLFAIKLGSNIRKRL